MYSSQTRLKCLLAAVTAIQLAVSRMVSSKGRKLTPSSRIAFTAETSYLRFVAFSALTLSVSCAPVTREVNSLVWARRFNTAWGNRNNYGTVFPSAGCGPAPTDGDCLARERQRHHAA